LPGRWARTTALDLSLDKRDDGLLLGADDNRATTDASTFADLAGPDRSSLRPGRGRRRPLPVRHRHQHAGDKLM